MTKTQAVNVARRNPAPTQHLKEPSKQSKRKEVQEKIVVRSLFAASLIIPQVILLSFSTETEAGPSPLHMYRQMLLSMARFPHFLSESPFLLVCFLLSLQNLSYSFVWIRPQVFTQFCKRNKLGQPVDVMLAIFLANKVIQHTVPFAWYASVAPIPSLFDLTAYQIGTGFQFIVLGQVLNIAIYRAIGKVGVYYGTRLGRQVPWVSGFPFNLISHPQYCGVVLTVFGLVVLLFTPAHCENGLFGLFVVQTTLYVIMGLVEQYL
eukprot:c18016_g1_i1.p1 GENE.c18016_g1_i1~~c18016_g1_i1.p1  ORF type:complete len:278 (+),score=45.01 c18016_g1_i1:46-834(+)